MLQRVHRFACLLACGPFLCFPPPARAQEAAPKGNTVQADRPSFSLADALRAAKQAPEGLTLAVGAQTIALPRSTAAQEAGGTVAEAAAVFGQITQTFGSVTAVAPPTATVLNTNPALSNVYDGLAPAEALKLLAASLDDAQWQALTGASGLGLGDLSSDA